MNKRGKSIIIEGGEGCGKGVQARELSDCFQEKKIPNILFREPGGTKEAEQIRRILLDNENKLDSETELFLYQAARRDLFKKEIIPALTQGTHVILDRSWPSTYAYQGYAGKINLNLIKNLTSIATFGINPDLLIIMNIDYSTGLSKEKNPDRFALKGPEYHKKVNEGYLNVAKLFPDISVIINYQEGKPELMQKKIQDKIKERLDIF